MTAYALTIHQPWAWAIVAGHKPVENRKWIPPREFVGQWLFIHAGKTLDMPAVEKVRAEVGGPALLNPERDLATGAILGCARYVGTATEDPQFRVPGVEVSDPEPHLESPWYVGPFGWVLATPVKFKDPVPARGMQKLWKPREDVLAECREQWRQSR